MREVMGLFLEVLQSPALSQAKIDLYKSQVRHMCSMDIYNMLSSSLTLVIAIPSQNNFSVGKED